MRTAEEIKTKIQLVETKLGSKNYPREKQNLEAILDVLENELEYEEIEEKYFDEHQTDRESSANKAREWLDGGITDLEFDTEFIF